MFSLKPHIEFQYFWLRMNDIHQAGPKIDVRLLGYLKFTSTYSVKSWFDSKLHFATNSTWSKISLKEIRLFIIHSEKKKTEHVTMKAILIHALSVESEFLIKNSIFPWKSELAWIWKFLRKSDYFWLFLSARILATLVTKLSLSFL